MIGDKIYITDKSKANAKLIYDNLNGHNIVLIGGCSGTQKSETGECLQELLLKHKKQSILLSLDDFYLVYRSVRNINRKKQGIECVGLKEIDWEMIYRIIEDFNSNKPIHFQRYHRYSDIIEHNVVDTEEINTLIIEGLFANYIRKTYSEGISIYLDGNPSQTMEFRKMRGKEDTEDEFRISVVKKEYNVVAQLKKYTDIVIPYEG